MKSLDHENINYENSLYLVFNNIDGYIIEENNENKFLIFALTKKNKKLLKNQIKAINSSECNFIEPIYYEKDSMKIRLDQMMIYPWVKC